MNVNKISNQAFTSKYKLIFGSEEACDNFSALISECTGKEKDVAVASDSLEGNVLYLYTGQDARSYTEKCSEILAKKLSIVGATKEINSLDLEMQEGAKVVDFRA